MNYIQHHRSPARRIAIIGAVVAFHAVLLLGLVGWWGRDTGVKGPGLIRVDIVPDRPLVGAVINRRGP